ncbi:hypothetical protein [Neorickettsia sp. 179522]|uniref:hypothetical protein n=1 Tax=Neorickettsia sp. 179522 TaxID=1714371 RepID=UPI000793B60C|nr:hypothetical protein [Neorickettsia sp. 179522]KYH12277.1 hypothetical protein AS219_00385 [Neorickettsia sp. 179522]
MDKVFEELMDCFDCSLAYASGGLSCFGTILPPLSDTSESEKLKTSVELLSVTEFGSLSISRVLLA